VATLTLVGGGLWLLANRSNGQDTKTTSELLYVEALPQNTEGTKPTGTPQTSSIGAEAEPLAPQKSIGSPALTGGLLQDVASLYQAGGTLDDPTKQSLAQNVADKAKDFFSKNLNTYTESDVVVDDGVTPREYLNQLSGVVQKYFSDKDTDPNYENEMTIIYDVAAQTQDAAGLSDKLQKYIFRYRSAAEELTRVHPPKKAASTHLNFINSFWNTAVALTAISNYSGDPVAGALGMHTYADQVSVAASLLKEAKSFATAHNIVFTKDDQGYFLQTYFDQIKS
jgi:hypothetical protein